VLARPPLRTTTSTSRPSSSSTARRALDSISMTCDDRGRDA